MAIPWLTLLKTVPWTDVIVNAPKVAEGAKRLWTSVARKPPIQEVGEETASASKVPDVETLASLQAELHALRVTTGELHQQMLASSALITELAEQNTALIKRVETYRIRLLWLAGVVALFAGLTLVSLRLAWNA